MNKKELKIIKHGKTHKWFLSARLLLGFTDKQAVLMSRALKSELMFIIAERASNFRDFVQQVAYQESANKSSFVIDNLGMSIAAGNASSSLGRLGRAMAELKANMNHE